MTDLPTFAAKQPNLGLRPQCLLCRVEASIERQIINRDRHVPLRTCVAWLRSLGYDDVTVGKLRTHENHWNRRS